ncbi:MAG: hypothetical protein K6E91_08775 [Butyrivibrio sp.]|nr:hypothetical protein [Butyrivibrio sp.]
MEKTRFEIMLEEKVNEQKGIYYPIRASLLERLLVRSISPEALHPNEADEFCFPDIGPNYQIISNY